MAQYIVYKNKDGGTVIVAPTGELPIETVLSRDCPPGAIIVSEASLDKEGAIVEASPQELETQPIKPDYQREINALEAAQHRAVRELLLGRPEALKKLQQLEIDVALMRSKLGA